MKRRLAPELKHHSLTRANFVQKCWDFPPWGKIANQKYIQRIFKICLLGLYHETEKSALLSLMLIFIRYREDDELLANDLSEILLLKMSERLVWSRKSVDGLLGWIGIKKASAFRGSSFTTLFKSKLDWEPQLVKYLSGEISYRRATMTTYHAWTLASKFFFRSNCDGRFWAGNRIALRVFYVAAN